jgi:anti-anti-sigma factor
MTPFDAQVREHADERVRLVDVSGELDLTNTHEFEARMDALGESDCILVLDLNRVLFVDSAALHALFRIARAQGPGHFGLVLEPSAAIARTLQIAAIPSVVPTRARVEELLAEVAASR